MYDHSNNLQFTHPNLLFICELLYGECKCVEIGACVPTHIYKNGSDIVGTEVMRNGNMHAYVLTLIKFPASSRISRHTSLTAASSGSSGRACV